MTDDLFYALVPCMFVFGLIFVVDSISELRNYEFRFWATAVDAYFLLFGLCLMAGSVFLVADALTH